MKWFPLKVKLWNLFFSLTRKAKFCLNHFLSNKMTFLEWHLTINSKCASSTKWNFQWNHYHGNDNRKATISFLHDLKNNYSYYLKLYSNKINMSKRCSRESSSSRGNQDRVAAATVKTDQQQWLRWSSSGGRDKVQQSVHWERIDMER